MGEADGSVGAELLVAAVQRQANEGGVHQRETRGRPRMPWTKGASVSGDVTANMAQQRKLYGEPLRDLADRVMGTLGLTQGRLAQILGLSAPMLSQLLSGRRTKIGNPAVVSRLYALLELVDEAPGLTATAIEARLEAVHEVQGTYSTTRTISDSDAAALTGLREAADPSDLRRAAALLAPDHPRLSALLRRAAEDAHG